MASRASKFEAGEHIPGQPRVHGLLMSIPGLGHDRVRQILITLRERVLISKQSDLFSVQLGRHQDLYLKCGR